MNINTYYKKLLSCHFDIKTVEGIEYQMSYAKNLKNIEIDDAVLARIEDMCLLQKNMTKKEMQEVRDACDLELYKTSTTAPEPQT